MKGSSGAGAGTTVVKEGYLELRLSGDEGAHQWIVMWVVVAGLPPIEGIRDWDDCNLAFYATSRVRTIAWSRVTLF